jgi:hypothetical protein
MPYGTVNADLMTTSDGVSSSGLYGFKNRIINGAMVIDQRNAGASVTQTTGDVFPVDRFVLGGSVTSKFTAQQYTTTSLPGFTNFLGCTSSAATSLGSGDYYFVAQYIEGLNCADLNWGTSNASAVTLSFYVQSSLTGTFGGALRNSAGNRSYPFSYTISSANTWERKTITIAGDTSGTWLATNGIGIRVGFSLGVGSTYSGTAGAWSGSNLLSATGATSVVGTNGATFYITGVQLEKGSTATSFDYRDYGTELFLCQRYCFTLISNGANNSTFGAFWRPATSNLVTPIFFPVTMRATPTCSIPAGNNSWSVEDGLNPYTGTPTIDRPTPYNVVINIPIGSNPSFSSGYATATHMFAASGGVCLLASAEL